MCNHYSLTKGQAAIIALTRAMRDTTGNMPSLPGIFPDYSAPIVTGRTARTAGKDVAAVIARNLEKRIAKLEASRQRPDELLLVWRRPNGDVRAAISEAKFAPGDRVISLEWDGDGPLPPPRWFGKRSELGIEDEYLKRCLTRSMALA